MGASKRLPHGAVGNEPYQQTKGKVAGVQTELRYDGLFLALCVPLGLGPKCSEVRVDAGTLHVKMGWAFDARIPLASITRAQATTPRVVALGVHYVGGRWLVSGSSKGLVALTIEPSAQAKVWFKTVTLSALWVSVTEPDALIAACTAQQ
jgi:hypothetical protein